MIEKTRNCFWDLLTFTTFNYLKLNVKFALSTLQWPHGALEKQIQYEVHFQKLSITNRISLLCPTGEFRQKISTLATLKIVVAAQLQRVPEDFWIWWGQSLNFTENIGISFGLNKWLKGTTVISPVPMRSGAPKQPGPAGHTGWLGFIPIIFWPLP